MKKKVLFSVLCLMICYCFMGQYILADSHESTFHPKSAHLKKIIDCLSKSKAGVLKALGDNYQPVSTGPEGILEGFFYENLGITITFDEEDQSVLWIECNQSVDINGARAGMNFIQIQKALGKNKVRRTWIETPDNIAYELTYTYKQCRIVFYSFNKNGADSMVHIMPQ